MGEGEGERKTNFLYIDLAEGGSIVNFKWDSGGSWKGRKWDQDLPSDSQVIIIEQTHFISLIIIPIDCTIFSMYILGFTDPTLSSVS